jgi:Phage tail lysozyme
MANDFTIRIGAEDKATAVVNKIKDTFAKIAEPIEKANKRMATLGNVGNVGLSKLQKSMDGVANSASKVVDKIVEIIPGLTAIGGAASIAGLSALATKFGNFGFGLNKSSKLLAMNAQDLAAWHVAAKRAGVSAEEFDSSMSGSQMAIRAAANGADPHAMVLLQKMGIQIAKNKDGTTDYYTTQMRLMKAIPKLKTVEAQRDVAGTFDMGRLLPMLQQGTYEADKARAIRKGLVPTPDEVARATAFHQNVNDLEDSVTGLGNSIGSKLIPVLDPLVTGFAKWLDSHRAEIADTITNAVQKFAEWVKGINWNEVVSKMTNLFDAMGGIKGVAIAIAAITFAGPIAGVLNLIAALTRLSTVALPAAIVEFGLLAAAGTAAELARQKALDKSIHKLPGESDADRDQRVAEAQAGGAVTPVGVQGPAKGQNIAYRAWRALDMKHAEISSKTNQAIQFMMMKGWTRAQATGIASNLWLESKFNEHAIGDNGSSRGIAQWHADRQAEFKRWSGVDIADAPLSMQLGFVDHELRNGTYTRAGGLLRRTSTADEAGRVVSQFYEQPKNVEAEKDNRGNYARGIYEYGLDPSVSPLAGPTGPDRQSGARIDDGSADHNSRVAALQKMAVDVTFHNVPPGVRPEVKSQDGGFMPTKINYALRGADGTTP